MMASVAPSANYRGITTETPISFEITNTPGTGETTKTVVYVKANDVTVTYGDSIPTFSYSAYKKDGSAVTFTNEEISGLDYTTNYEVGSSVGSYTVVPKGITSNSGYTLVYQPGSIIVNKKQVSLNWSADTFTYNGETRTVTASVTEGLVGADSILVTGYETSLSGENKVTNTAVNAGSYIAKAISFDGVNIGNYELSGNSASHNWTITKAESSDGNGQVPEGANVFTIAPAIQGWTYGETPNAPIGTAKYGTVEFTYSDSEQETYTNVQPTNAGNYYMKATVAGTDNYGGLSSTPIAFSIAKAPVTIIADDKSGAYGETISALTYVISGKIIEDDDLQIQLSTSATQNAVVGKYPITVDYDTSNSNYDVTKVDGNYFITAKTTGLQVTASGYTGVYDGNAHGITVVVKDDHGNVVDDAVVYYSETRLTTANYGSGKLVSPTYTDACEKTVYYYVETPTHEPITGEKTVSIQKKEVIATAKDHTIVYGEEPTNNGIQYTGFVENETETTLGIAPTYTYTYEQFEEVGNYQICPVVAETTNYKFTAVNGNLEVTQKPVTFIWSANGFVYDASKKMVTAQVVDSVNEDDVRVGSYVTNTSAQIQNSAIPVGQYTAAVNSLIGENAANYKFEQTEASASHIWTITEATNFFKVTPSIADWNYGETASVPQATSAYGTVRYEYSNNMYGQYSAMKPVKAGTYYMKAIVDATADYGVLESTPIPFTIHKAEICVTAEDKFSKPGDEQLQQLTYVVTGNVLAGEKLEVNLETTATLESVEGNYPITVSVEASENYEVSTVNGQYYISEQDYSISAEGVNVQYDGKYHGIKVSVKDANGNMAEDVNVYYSETALGSASITDWSNISSTSPLRRDAGTTNVYYYIVKEDEVILSGEKSIMVTRAALTVTANDAIIVVGNKPINNGVIYEGFVNQEDETFLSGTVSYQYDYNENLSEGIYCITPSGLMSKNYDITFKDGMLTVLPIPEEVDILITPQNGVYNAKPHIGYSGEPSAAQGEVTDFEYMYKDSDGVELIGAPITPGTYTLTVTIPKNHLYYRGSKTITFTISKRQVVVKPTEQAMYAGSTFTPVEPIYSGFLGEDNKKPDEAFATPPEITLWDEDGYQITSFDNVSEGTYILRTSTGSLTAEASKYYEVTTAVSKLTVFKNPADITEETPKTDASVKFTNDEGNTAGTVGTAVIKDEDAPKAELEADLTVEKAEALLTDAEKDLVKGGENALIYLLWSQTDEAIHKEEIEEIRSEAEEKDKDIKVELTMDASLFKVVGNADPVKIPDTGEAGKVTVSIVIPEALRNTNPAIIRTYYVIYVHNGEVRWIENSVYTSSSHELSFEASEFSVYAIGYKDVVNNTNSDGDNQGNAGGNLGGSSGGNSGGDYDGGSDNSSDSGSGANDNKDSNTEDNMNGNEEAKGASGSGKKPNSGSNKNPANSKDKESGQSSEKNQDNKAEGTEDTGSQESQEQQKETLKDTPKAETMPSIPKEKEKQLNDALEELQKKVPNLQPGSFIKVVVDPSTNGGNDVLHGEGTIGGENALNGAGEDGKVTFTIDIPEEIAKEGRNYYLVTVDKDGNIVVLQNESIVNGTLTFTGDPNATYQIVYEDGGATLPDVLNEKGWLVDENGKSVTVDTNHCFLHYIVLLLAAIGIFLTLFFKGKQKKQLLTIGIDTIAMIILTLVGWCTWDIVVTILGVAIMSAIFVWSKKNKDRNELSYE